MSTTERQIGVGEVAHPPASGGAPARGPDDPLDLRGALAVTGRVLRTGLLGCAIGLVAAELALRLFTGLPNGLAFSVRAAYDLDDVAVGPFIPHARVNITWPPETAFVANFNSLGCRGAEPRDVEAPAVLAVGDSLTLGLGVQDDETWPAYLDRMLAERGSPRPVVNLSSALLMLDDELRYLDRALPEVKPGLVVLLIPPMGDGGYFGPDGLTPHQRGLEHERRTRHRFAGSLRELALTEARFYVKVWRQRKRLEGAGEFPPQLVVPFSGRMNTAPPAVHDRYQRLLLEFKQRVEAAGATLVIATFTNVALDADPLEFHSGWTAAVAAEIGAVGVDAAPAFAAQPDPAALMQLPFDAHASALGNEVLARTILDTLVENGLVE